MKLVSGADILKLGETMERFNRMMAMYEAEIDPLRLEELAAVFEEASRQRGNIIEPPFNAVAVNLHPESWAQVATALRFLSKR